MQDLGAILLYRQEVAGRRSAVDLRNILIDAFIRLKRFPHLSTVRPDITRLPLRFHFVRGYWIVLRPQPFQIVRIIDARRDVAAILG